MRSVFGNLRRPRCGGDEASRGLYKAQLCAGCHAMREFSGRPTSLLANYDQSLLALVVSGVAGGVTEPRACTALPWRTVDVQQLSPPLRTLLAAGNLVLVDAKLRDDLDDGPRWWTRPVRWLLRGKVRRAYAALEALGFATVEVHELPLRQRAAERAAEGAAEPSLATLAQPSAALLGEVFAHAGQLAHRTELVADLQRFGHAVGRAVYAFDALDDHDDDRRRGHFNAVAALAKRLGHGAAVAAVQREVELATVQALQALPSLLESSTDGPLRIGIVRQVLQHLARRATLAGERLLARPATAAMRPGEAGDCDVPCDGCDCDCPSGCPPIGCDPCCDVWCCSGSDRRRRRNADRQLNEPNDDR